MNDESTRAGVTAKLVVVDDARDVADALAELLAAEGHSVRVAYDGQQGAALVARERPDLILCDVEMPVLDGPGLSCLLARRDHGDEDVPILLMSGIADLRRVAERVGTPYFVGKPFEMDQLYAVIERALREKKAPAPQA